MSDITQRIIAGLNRTHDEMEKLKAENRIAIARVARLEAALQKIADPQNYTGGAWGEYLWSAEPSPADIARAALEAQP